MKRLLFVMIAFVPILVICGNNSSEDKGASKDSKTISVGTEGIYVPFSFYDKDGKLTGYDIDAIKAVAKEESLKLRFSETPWDSMFTGLDAGRFDVVANQVGANPDREKKYKFSKFYILSNAVLVIRENGKDIKDFDDVKGKGLAQTFTPNHDKLAKGKDANIAKVDDSNQSMDLLLFKRVDGTFNDSLPYLDYKRQKPNAKIKAIKGNAEQSGPAFVFSKRADNETVRKFSDGLKKVGESGELAETGKKWFGQDVSKSK